MSPTCRPERWGREITLYTLLALYKYLTDTDIDIEVALVYIVEHRRMIYSANYSFNVFHAQSILLTMWRSCSGSDSCCCRHVDHWRRINTTTTTTNACQARLITNALLATLLHAPSQFGLPFYRRYPSRRQWLRISRRQERNVYGLHERARFAAV